MFRGVDAECAQAVEIEFLDVRRAGFEHHLVLVVVLQAVGVLAVTAVLGPPRGLHIGGAPRLGADRTEKGGGVEGAGADFNIVGLEQDTALFVPEVLQAQDDFLKSRPVADFQ